jgi:hypothetical protein
MWEQSMEGMMGLVSKSTPSGYTFLAERSGSTLFNKVPNNEYAKGSILPHLNNLSTKSALFGICCTKEDSRNLVDASSVVLTPVNHCCELVLEEVKSPFIQEII